MSSRTTTRCDTFQRAANDVSDPQLRAYAENTLPTLREHDIKAKQDLKNEAKCSAPRRSLVGDAPGGAGGRVHDLDAAGA